MAGKDICVSVQHVSKRFSRSLKRSFLYGARDIGLSMLGRSPGETLRPSEFWALRDVSLELRDGQAIGIIGLNGSGKTTLLRLISGIFQPTLGSIRVHGRIAPMLALGAGFKPVLSGRENIVLNLSLLGVPERLIAGRIDAIVDFAELHEAIDAPLGTYSSGMKARLGFACAVHTDPRILVVDEVLAVGDSRFRAKCRNRINELRRQGASMLLVSHNSLLVESLTDECLYLSKGEVAGRGAPAEMLALYERDLVDSAKEANASQARARPQEGPDGERALQVLELAVRGGAAGEEGCWVSGEYGQLAIALKSAQHLDNVTANVMIVDQTHQVGETVQILRSSHDDGALALRPGAASITLALPQVGLRPGTYRLKVNISQIEPRRVLDVVDNVRLVVRDAGYTRNCLFFQPRQWSYDGADVMHQDK